MNDKDMAELLEELRATVAESDGLSDEDRAHLEGLANQIEAEVDESLAESVEDAMTRFGVEHRGLARVINRIADSLSAGGI